MLDSAYYILMLFILLIGWMINIVGLPGLWLMVTIYGLYALVTGWNTFVGYPSLITLIVLALLAEAAEFGASAAGSKAAGGRKRGMIGGVIGAFVGGIVLSFVIPIPIVNTIIGALAGAFVGAAAMEFTDREFTHALKVGVGAAKGRLWAIAIKMLFGLAMFLVALFAGLPIHAAASTPAKTPAPPPATSPTTSPSISPAATSSPG